MKKSFLFGFAAAVALASCTTNEDVLQVSEQRDLAFGTFVDKATKLFDSTTGLEKDGNTFGVWGYYVSGEEFTTGAENVFASTPITVTRTNDVWGYGEAAKWIPNKN
ncbi:MAG: fimbrillin family protein, partial [Bacteroidales bacterium]